jgi:hypothetical protein
MVQKGFKFWKTKEEYEKMRQGVYKEEWKELEVLAVENHKVYFDIAQILSVLLGFFSTKLGIML